MTIIKSWQCYSNTQNLLWKHFEKIDFPFRNSQIVEKMLQILDIDTLRQKQTIFWKCFHNKFCVFAWHCLVLNGVVSCCFVLWIWAMRCIFWKYRKVYKNNEIRCSRNKLILISLSLFEYKQMKLKISKRSDVQHNETNIFLLLDLWTMIQQQLKINSFQIYALLMMVCIVIAILTFWQGIQIRKYLINVIYDLKIFGSNFFWKWLRFQPFADAKKTWSISPWNA